MPRKARIVVMPLNSDRSDFTESRDNFPSWEDACLPGDTLVDPSTVSNNSSFLSIGAKAALAEHLRHVSKHGLDESSSALRNDTPDHPLDRHWEALMDGHNLSHISWYNSSDQGVEILKGEASSDYFDSSRVQLLFTPEKNRDKLDRVSHRGYTEESFSSDSAEVGMFSIDSPEVSSEEPLAAVDISRISADGSDAPIKHVLSPDCSFAQDHRSTIDDVQHLFASMQSVASPIVSRSFPKPPSSRSSLARVSPYAPTKENLPPAPIARRHNTSATTAHSDLSSLRKSLDFGGSSRESPRGAMSPFLDRRLYRTVVPTRVFMTEPDDFPEQYDSFSARPTHRSI